MPTHWLAWVLFILVCLLLLILLAVILYGVYLNGLKPAFYKYCVKYEKRLTGFSFIPNACTFIADSQYYPVKYSLTYDVKYIFWHKTIIKKVTIEHTFFIDSTSRIDTGAALRELLYKWEKYKPYGK